MNFDFTNQTILVTGCNGNLGKKIVNQFLLLGASVIGTDINKDHTFKSKKFKYFKTNLSNEDQVKQLFSKLNNQKLDILINNAALSFKGGFEKRTKEEIKLTIDVNFYAPLILIKEFIKRSKKNSSKIVLNIASIYGVISPDHLLYKENKKNNSEIYGATKASLIQITKYFAKYYGEKGFRFNSISPGGFLDNKVVKDKLFIKKYSKKVPLGRMGHADEIVPSVIFLCSGYSSYINGHNLIIDGGMSS